MVKLLTSSTWSSAEKTLIIPISKKEKALDNIEPLAAFTSTSLSKTFKGEKNEIQIIPTEKQTIILLGLGTEPLETKVVSRVFRTLSHRLKDKLSNDLGLYLLHFEETEMLVECAANGLFLGTYQIGVFKTDERKNHVLETDKATLTIYAKDKEASIKKAAKKGIATAETQMSIFDLVNAPSNKKTPQVLAKWAKESGEKYNYRVEVWDKAKIEQEKMGALLAVNRGSEDPPHFIIMEYKGEGASKKVGLVGKGVTFDTGGLSIKGATNMHYMKSDMGGAAAVLGTMELAAKLKLPVHLIGMVPTTDNSIDALSIKPSDVIHSYSGKTIEIIDTDAEGRLILADGISYMVRQMKPDVLIDLATLTGSAVRTFGYHAGALFSNNDELANALSVAGDETGERVWRLPIWKVYEEDLKSDVADVKNFSGRPLAGAIGAAKFLEYFTDEHPNWAHLDIAGVAFSEAEFSTQKSSTAFGIRLLVEYLAKL